MIVLNIDPFLMKPVPCYYVIRLTCQWVAKTKWHLWCIYFIWEKVSTRLVHNFLNIDPFLMKIVPFESSRSQLSNGTIFIKNGFILRKFWSNRVKGFENESHIVDIIRILWANLCLAFTYSSSYYLILTSGLGVPLPSYSFLMKIVLTGSWAWELSNGT